MFNIGDTLREARIRQGLSLKDVVDSLKIRGKYLQALEDDDFEVIPGSTFVKAFLRSYASFLGLEADALVAEYVNAHERPAESPRGSQGRTPGPRTRPQARRSQPNYLMVAVIALIVIAVLVVIFGDRGQEPAVIEPENATTSTLPPADQESGSAPDATQASSEVEAGAAVLVASGADAAPIEDPDGDRLDLLVEVVQNRCWLVVREESEAGKTLYSGTLSEGERLTYATDGRFWLRIGDPSAIVIYADGQPLPLSEPYGDFVVSDSGLQRLE